MPPIGMPTCPNSAPRQTSGSPRAKSDRIQPAPSRLSAGTSFSKSAPSNGPATACQGAMAAAVAARPPSFRKSRRAMPAWHPQAGDEQEAGSRLRFMAAFGVMLLCVPCIGRGGRRTRAKPAWHGGLPRCLSYDPRGGLCSVACSNVAIPRGESRCQARETGVGCNEPRDLESPRDNLLDGSPDMGIVGA